MLICPSCNTQAPETAKFCRKCGSTLVPEKAGTPEAVAKRQSFEARLKAEPQNATLMEEYGDFLLSVGLVEDALVKLHRAADIAQDNVALLLKIAQAYETIQQWDNAAAQIRRALEVRPDNPALYERLATVLLQGGQNEEAINALTKQSGLAQDNLPILIRMRDLLRELKEHEHLASVCRAILKKEPRDLTTWLLLADGLLVSNKREEAVEAFEAVLNLNPDEPRANLYVGIARHDAALYSKDVTFDEARRFLEKAVTGRSKLAGHEGNRASLYLVSAKLHSGAATLETQPELERVAESSLNQEQRELLAICFLLFGDIEKKAGMLDEALESYEESLRLHDTPSARKRLAEAHGEKGEEYLCHRKYVVAHAQFERALSYVPDEPTLAAKRAEAVSRQKRKHLIQNLVVAVIVLVIGLIAAFWYYGQGAFDISTTPAATVSLKKGDKPIGWAANGQVRTSLLRCGSYRLAVEKDGYEPVDRELKIGLGRKTQTVTVTLKPIYGSLKVNSDPPGAQVTVRNKYEEKSATTPCEIAELFALPSSITVSLPDCVPFLSEKPIPPWQALDLGTIIFKGNLKLDSQPTGAQVLIDNELRGVTPLEITGLLAKPTSVVVRKQNVGVFAQEVRIEPEKTTDLGKVSLSNRGALKVASNPMGAVVFMDGEPAGETPLVLNDVEVGEHRIRITVPDCVPYETTVVVKTGEISDLGEVSFSGSVKLDSEPTGLEVYFEGNMKGKTPIIIKDLKAVATTIELKYPGRGLLPVTVGIKPDEVIDLGVLKVVSKNLVAGLPCITSSRGADSGSGKDSDGKLTYKLTNGVIEGHGRASREGGALGWQNSDYRQEMSVTVSFNLKERHHIHKIRYNMGDCMRANTWNPDSMTTPFGTISTRPGSSYKGVWTDQVGDATVQKFEIEFKKTRTSYETDWLSIAEIEVWGDSLQ